MDHNQGNSTPTKKGIRFEDLGEPIQQLMLAMQAKGRGDMSLLEYVGVRDVAKVLEAQGLGLEPDAIWDDLEAELIRRREARENPDLARQKEEERRRAEQERRQELRRAKALREQEEEQARREAEEQEAQRLREEKAAQKAAEQLERRRREEEARLAAEAAHQQQLAREREEEEQRRQLEYAQRQAEAQREAERRTEAEQRVEAERRAEAERQAAAERRAEAERQAVAERQAEAERRQREADERQAVERRRQELQAEEERLLLLRQAREAEVQRLEEVQRQHEAERQRWEEERRRQAEDFRARQEEEERRLQLLAAAQQAQEEERRRRREEEERQWQAEAEARRRQAEDERRQREAAQQHEELARRAALERRGQEDAAQRAQQAREAERLRQEEERLRLERLRLEEETAAAAAVAEREEAARRRREEALQERQRQVEAEDARLLDTPYLQLEDVTVHWSYLAPGASQWEAFPAPVQQILEQALMESTARTAIPMPGQTWTAFVLDMYAQTARGEPFPIRRAYSDEPTVASRPAERTAPLAVWSSYNPLSRKWERFPLLVSRVLELKYRAGAPSVDVLILGKLRFSIVFRDMRQVSDAGFFRQVQRTEQRPVWERFSAHSGIPAWEELPGPVSQLLEDCFAAGEQKAEVISQDPAGQPRQYTLELDTMRAVAGDHVQGLRRQLRAADGGPAAEVLRAPPGPLPAPPVTLPPPPAARSAAFLEVYTVPPQLVQHVVQHRVPPSLRYPLAVGQTTVGREASDGPNSIVLQGAELSRRHCVVDVTPQGEVFVTDTSTGGTAMLSAGAYVRLPPTQRQRVEPGTFLALAQTLVRVGEVI